MSERRKAVRLLLATLAIYGVLVATHLGEFWPFSIYPMFSQAGRPWSRAVVREVEPIEPVVWDTLAREQLPGSAFPLTPNKVDPIDIANFVTKTQVWSPGRAEAIRRHFLPVMPENGRLIVLRANGRLVGDDSIAVEFVPYVVLDAESAVINPVLAPD